LVGVLIKDYFFLKAMDDGFFGKMTANICLSMGHQFVEYSFQLWRRIDDTQSSSC
jgi:hypothetical protein